MACQTCGNSKTSWCGNCPPSDNLIAKVDALPDPFNGDRDHLYMTPQGVIYALAPDRNSWVKVSGDKEAMQYPNITITGAGDYLTADGHTIKASKLVETIVALNNKKDNNTTYTQELSGNTLTLKGSDGNDSSVQLPEYASKATVQEHDNRISTLEHKEDKDTVYTAGKGINISDTNEISSSVIKQKEIQLSPDGTWSDKFPDNILNIQAKNSQYTILGFSDSSIELFLSHNYTITVPFYNPKAGVKVNGLTDRGYFLDYSTTVDANRGELFIEYSPYLPDHSKLYFYNETTFIVTYTE